ncbi:MAG: hypothetical protein PGN22_02595 [Agrobacterium cavarae]
MSPPTIVSLYPPITVATVLAVGWFIVAYRFHLRDRHKPYGEESLRQILWLLIGPGCLGVFFYFQKDKPLTTPFAVMMTALIGVAIGFLMIFAIRSAFFDSTTDRKTRNIYKVYLVFFAIFFAVPFFIYR